ncbi:HXXEE domain-containing protein [Streptomyces albus]|uniref:HXXEE domain-containing protein n=1 Tax=Streptomyces albus TaxID=1888 RepID=UPI000A9F4EB9
MAAWVLHDAEEVAVTPRRLRARVPELRKRLPQVPERLWRRLETIDEREFATAVAAMGVLITAAAADGYRTGGRSAFYQSTLNGFGLWGRGRLRRAGVLRPTRASDAVRGLALAAAAVGASHAVARRVRGGRRSLGGGRQRAR